MAQRQNSFEVSVKRLLLIRFICSATSKPFVHAELQTFHSTQPSQGFSVVEQRCKSPQTVKKKKKKSHLAGGMLRCGGAGRFGVEESCWAIKMTDSSEKCFAGSHIHAK